LGQQYSLAGFGCGWACAACQCVVVLCIEFL